MRLPIEAFVAITFLFVGVCVGVLSTRDRSETGLSAAGLADQLSLPHGPILPVGLESTDHQDASLSASDLAVRSNLDLGPTASTNSLDENSSSTDEHEGAPQPEGLAVVPIERAEIDTTHRSADSSGTLQAEDDLPPEPRVATASESPFAVAPEANDAAEPAPNAVTKDASDSVEMLPLAADLLTKPLQGRMSVVENALKVALPTKSAPETKTAAGPGSSPPAVCEDGTCTETMKSHGTELQWAESPAAAYQMAGVQNKLVFLIHVSGNFEIPGFT